MRIPFLLASALAFALAACGSGQDESPAGRQAAEAAMPEWTRDLEKQLMAALAGAPRHGLARDLFLKDELPSDPEQRNRALTRIATDYASALALGKTDPKKLHEVYTLPRAKLDVRAGLRQAMAEGRLGEWLDSLAPQTDEYRALSAAFVRTVQGSPDLPDADIPAGEPLGPGETDPRVPAIARHLESLGYLPEPGEGTGRRYTDALAQAVARFQADSGLEADGIIGDETIAALNTGPRDRARQLAVAMERLRWLERNPPPTRIDVNIAATELTYFRDGRLVDRRRVVAGQPDWETPQLASPMFRLVANPSWTVPESIEEEELSKKPASYFREQNIVRKNGRLVQLPGPKNALGAVKFDMSNDESIYLHDTPHKQLFAAAERHESHGCVRVEGALDFARMIAAADGVLMDFDGALAGGKEAFVKLNREIPVRLMYRTAFLGPDGRVHLVPDVYGWDNGVAAALGYERKAPALVKPHREDVGP